MKERYERHFSRYPSEVAAARSFVAEKLDKWSLADTGAILAVSELATNAVRHAAAPFTVRIARLGRQVRVEVANESSPFAAVSSKVAGDQESGRGLWIVESITTGWGHDSSQDDETTWFTVPAVRLTPQN